MEKIFKFIDRLDPKVMDKLIYLDRIVKLYSKFLREWKAAEVLTDGDLIEVRFFRINKYGYKMETSREFDFSLLVSRIEGYKRKLAKEFKERHSNDRIRRENETNKWRKYINNAEVQM